MRLNFVSTDTVYDALAVQMAVERVRPARTELDDQVRQQVPAAIAYHLFLGLAGLVLALVGGLGRVEEALWSAVVGGGLLYLTGWLGQWIFKRESMGGGDVKLVAGMGLFLGVSGILDGLIWACGMGALVGIGLRLSGRLEPYAEVPFAPFLGLGAGIHLLSGIELLEFLMKT